MLTLDTTPDQVELVDKLVKRFNSNPALLNRALREKYNVDLTTPHEEVKYRSKVSSPIKKKDDSSSELLEVEPNLIRIIQPRSSACP